MRTAFVDTLLEAAKESEAAILLTADMGFSVLERFRDAFPNRFINVGVAEANLVGVAAGLALGGFYPITYSIVPFMTMRCFEQIRNDLCQQQLDALIVGVGGGLAYGPLGASHHSLEDVAIMRALPGMRVICPGDPFETREAVRQVLRLKGPTYLRIGKGHDPCVHSSPPNLKVGQALTLKKGKDVALVASGSMLASANKACELLGSGGIHPTLISMHTVKPLDQRIILELAATMDSIFTIEEHSIVGGLGSAVSEVLCEAGYSGRFMRIGLPDSYVREIGNRDYLMAQYGLLPEGIASTVSRAMAQKTYA